MTGWIWVDVGLGAILVVAMLVNYLLGRKLRRLRAEVAALERRKTQR